jgi:CS domain
MSSSERPSSPTPSERERLDADARKKEEAEQATLPYKWTQTIGEVDVAVPIPGNLKARDLVVEIKKTRIKAQVKGQEALIEVSEMDAHSDMPDDVLTSLRPGRLSKSHSSRRMHLDARDNSYWQRDFYPSRQTAQVRVVGPCRDHCTQDRRHKDSARELQIERSGRRDERYGREDDV